MLPPFSLTFAKQIYTFIYFQYVICMCCIFQVQKAVAALFNLLKDTKKASFIDEAEKIHLQFIFKKVPNVKNKTLHL